MDGVEVWTSEDRDPEKPSCEADWIVGVTVTSHVAGDLMARVRAVDCDEVTPMIAPLVATLRANPGGGSPLRPLLYGPDDPDSPYPGACAYIDLRDRTDCAPYVSTALPAGELVSAKDPDVDCAVAKDAVTKGFGAEMEPVTMGDQCYFAHPTGWSRWGSTSGRSHSAR